MGIYTKTGDKGTTGRFDQTRVGKDDIRVESYGTVDELGSWLGLCRHEISEPWILEALLTIQNRLFVVCASLATSDPAQAPHKITETDIAHLEGVIDRAMGEIDNPEGFIVPGSSRASAHLHVARTVCRRAERRIVQLQRQYAIDPLVVKYVNRLSDAIYACARRLEDEQRPVNYSDGQDMV